MRRRVSILLLAGLLAACGSGSGTASAPGVRTVAPSAQATALATVQVTAASPGAHPVPDPLTPGDDGATFTMRLGETTSLILDDPTAEDPLVEGTSVEVIGMDNIQASGRREFELRAREPGRTILRGSPPLPYTITIDVAG